MPPEERQRIQERMTEWARMTPDERGRARLQFQEARQISPQERQARWDAYLALPADERRALAKSASTVPKAGAARQPHTGRRAVDQATAAASVQKNNVVTTPSTAGRGQDHRPHRGAGQARRQHHADLEDRLAATARPGRAAEDCRQPGQGQPQHAAAPDRAAERRSGARLGGAMTADAGARASPGARPAASPRPPSSTKACCCSAC